MGRYPLYSPSFSKMSLLVCLFNGCTGSSLWLRFFTALCGLSLVAEHKLLVTVVSVVKLIGLCRRGGLCRAVVSLVVAHRL